MANLPVRQLGAGLSLMLVLGAGCASTHSQKKIPDRPPQGTPCQLVATWENRVMMAPDTMHNGKPMPGIAGRVYLFGQEIGHPVGCPGMLRVDLFKEHDGKPMLIEQWNLDPVTLKNLQSRDRIGWGYTLFLPWNTYDPNICKVWLRVYFQGEQSGPLFSDMVLVTLAKENGIITNEGQALPLPPSPGPVPPPPPSSGPTLRLPFTPRR